jgi:putative membrane protein
MTGDYIRKPARFSEIWDTSNQTITIKENIFIMKLFLRWLFLAIAIGLTAWLMPGVTVQGTGTTYLVNLFLIAAVFGLVNAFVRPLVLLLTCPLVILTFGLFTLVINALMLSLTNWLLPNILIVDGFWATFFAALVIAIISGILNLFVKDD